MENTLAFAGVTGGVENTLAFAGVTEAAVMAVVAGDGRILAGWGTIRYSPVVAVFELTGWDDASKIARTRYLMRMRA